MLRGAPPAPWLASLKACRPALLEGRHALGHVGARPCPAIGFDHVGIPTRSASSLLSSSLWPAMVSGARAAISAAHATAAARSPARCASAEAQGGRGVELLGGQQHGPGRARPGEQGQSLHRPVVDHQPEFGGRNAEPGGRGDDPQVTGDRQLGAAPSAAPWTAAITGTGHGRWCRAAPGGRPANATSCTPVRSAPAQKWGPAPARHDRPRTQLTLPPDLVSEGLAVSVSRALRRAGRSIVTVVTTSVSLPDRRGHSIMAIRSPSGPDRWGTR